MKKWLFLGSFLFFIFSQAVSQVDFNNYRLLKSSGTLPEEFSKTYRFSKRKSTAKTPPKDDKEAFSGRFLEHLMRSGDVLYNDEIGNYLNRIMQTILQANGIENDVRVYVLKSADANAFAFHKDVVLVTMGMLAQVSTEAELAFILCHEYVHYRDKHTEIEYNETVRIEKEERRTKRLTQDEIRYLKSRYSKDLEMQADAGGLALFLNTPYNIEAVSTTFDVLRFSDLPFEEEEYHLSHLETPYLKISEKYFLKDVAPVVIDPEKEKENSKYSSHPDIETRRVEMLTRLETASGGKQDFVISESDFYLYRKQARYEVCRLQILNRDYANAFYSTYLLLEEEPNSQYLKRMAVRSLYGLTTYANANKLSKVLTGYKKIAGNSQRVFYMFNEMKKKEINFIALNYAWRVHQQFPADADITAVCDELIMQAVNKHQLSPYYFKTELPDTTTKQTLTSDSLKTDTAAGEKKGNKYSKIKTVTVDSDKNKNTKTTRDSYDYLQYAFIDIIQDASFKDRIRYFYDIKKEDEEDEENGIKNKRVKIKVIDEKRPVVNEVVFIEPQKVLVDTRPKAKKGVIYADDETKTRLYGTIQKTADMTGVKENIVDRYTIGEEEVADLNEFALMSDFVAEQGGHENRIVMLPTDYIELKTIQDKYETPYIGIIGVVSFKSSSRTGKILSNVFMPFLYWFALPYGIFRAAQPSYSTFIFAEIYDLETGKKVYTNIIEYGMRPSTGVVNPALYDILQDMKNKK